MTEQQQSKVWYKEPWPWLLMAGPASVVVAAFFTYYLAVQNNSDLVSDDYYKDGKHIDLDIKRDREAVSRDIHAQVLVNAERNAAKVFISGRFDPAQPIRLTFLHPAKKAFDQSVTLQDGKPSGDKTEYSAVFKSLPPAVHWYVRVEDAGNQWRVEDKWLVSQGPSLELKPLGRLLDRSGNPNH